MAVSEFRLLGCLVHSETVDNPLVFGSETSSGSGPKIGESFAGGRIFKSSGLAHEFLQ